MESYQHKRNSLTETVSGKEDVKQCVKTIASTQKGSVPFMPEFGCDLFPAVGEKSPLAIDYLIGVYTREISLQEPRCEISEVVGDFTEDGQIKMTIYFTCKEDENSDFVELYV